jgi:hypothetical protein
MPVVARASCPWVCVKPSDMGKMPMPLALLSIRRCAYATAANAWALISMADLWTLITRPN